MSTTFALELDSRPNKSGQIPVYIRFTQKRKIKRVKTSVTVRRRSDWNPKAKNENWVRPADPDYTNKNDTLSRELNKAKAMYLDQAEEGPISLQRVATAYKTADVSPSFLDYVERLAERQDATGHIRNAKTYRKFKHKLELFKPGGVVFADIDIAFVTDFETFLSALPNQRRPDQRLSVNSIHTEMKTFRAILQRAVAVDKIIKDTPFRDYKLREEKTTKDKLTREEMERLIGLDLPMGSTLRHTRNAFLLSYYCAGIRAGDLIQLRWSNVSGDGRISYVMDKTDKVRDLVLIRQVREILDEYDGEHGKDDYIFPFLDNKAPWARFSTPSMKKRMPVETMKLMYNKIGAVNALLNKYLGKLAKMADIDKKVSFHVSRHSFAYQALQDDIDPMTIKGALAHGSLLTTETYLKDFEIQELDNTLQRMFDKQSVKDKALKLLRSLSPEDREEVIRLCQGTECKNA